MMQTEAPNVTAAPPLPRWQRMIVRWRWVMFGLVALVHILAFNGQWRIGRDSALYRGLAQGIAGGKMLVTPAQADGLVLPGYPFMLAGMRKVFGDSMFNPWPQLLVMEAMAGLALVMVYRLLSMRLPQWLAILSTAALGVNWKFVQQANELMTDMPFLLGVVSALLGYELLRSAATRGATVRAALLAGAGLVFAASMRPTFVALAGAWGAACVWQLIRGRDRKANLIALALLAGMCVCVIVMVVAMPSRVQVQQRAQRSWSTAIVRVKHMLGEAGDDERNERKGSPGGRMLNHHLPEAVFGIELWYFSIFVSLALIVYGLCLGWINPMWGLLVLLSALMFAFVGSVPRYFLMIMPLLIVGWLGAAHVVGQLLPDRYGARGLLMLGAAGLLLVPSIGRSMGLVLEQHGMVIGRHKAKSPGAQQIVSFLPVYRIDFAHSYRDGKFVPIIDMATQIAATVPEGQAVLGPEPRIMTYVSGRRVVVIGDANRENLKRSAFLKKHKVRWAVWPREVYAEKIDGQRQHPHWLLYPEASTYQTLGNPHTVVIPNLPKRAPMTLLPLQLRADVAATQPTTRKVRPTTGPSTQSTTRPTTKKAGLGKGKGKVGGR